VAKTLSWKLFHIDWHPVYLHEYRSPPHHPPYREYENEREEKILRFPFLYARNKPSKKRYSRILSPPLSHTHTISLPLTHTLFLSLTHSLSHTLSRPLYHTLSFWPSLTLSLSHSIHPIPVTLPLTFTPLSPSPSPPLYATNIFPLYLSSLSHMCAQCTLSSLQVRTPWRGENGEHERKFPPPPYTLFPVSYIKYKALFSRFFKLAHEGRQFQLKQIKRLSIGQWICLNLSSFSVLWFFLYKQRSFDKTGNNIFDYIKVNFIEEIEQ